jgi:hypothetical protein
VHRRAFYCVSDADYFLGLVALVNSLRLVGQREPIIVLDCGLEPSQRTLLEREATVLTPSRDRSPIWAKFDAPLQLPAAEVMVVIDVDVIAVRTLAELLDRAASGSVVAFTDDQPAYFNPEWRSVLDCPELKPRTYVNAGFLALPGDFGPELIRRIREVQDHLFLNDALDVGDRPIANPFRTPDQDVANAVLSEMVPDARIATLDHALAPFQPWEKVQLDDRLTLRCHIADGRRPYLLHHIDDKPWLKPMPGSAYSALLPRLLCAEDIALQIEFAELPYRLRQGAIAGVWRWWSNKAAGARVGFQGWRGTL